MIDRVSDEAVSAAVVPTLRAVHSAAGGPWAQASLAQLVALLEHVRTRQPDARPSCSAALAAALDALGENSLVPSDGSVEARASTALAAAVGRGDAAADAVRAALRPVLVAELDEELERTVGLLDAFRGRMPDA